MSNISTILDRIYVVLDTLLPSGSSYTRLTNAYDLEDNPEHLTRLGYGLLVGSSNQLDTEFHVKTVQQSLSVVLTRNIIKINTNNSPVDMAIKAILEDANTIEKAFYNVNQLEIGQSIEDVDVIGSSAITYYKGDTNFISLEIEFNFTISENL